MLTEMHPQGEAEHAALNELEWAHQTLRKCYEIIFRNSHIGSDELNGTRMYLLTSMLWLKEAIQAQRMNVERRFGERKKPQSPPATSAPQKGEAGEGKRG